MSYDCLMLRSADWPNLKSLRSWSGALVLISALYPAGLLIGLASSNSPSGPLVRLLALGVLYALLSAPSWLLFLGHVMARPARDSLFRQICLLATALSFGALWLFWTPFIFTATKEDALGILTAFATPLCQLAVWAVTAIALGIERLTNRRTAD